MLLEEKEGEVRTKRPPQTDINAQPEEHFEKKENI